MMTGRNVRMMAAIISGLIIAAGIAAWALDRHPPFDVLSSNPASVRRGEAVMLTAQTRRDVHRHCSATFARYLYLSNGHRIDLEGDQSISADQIEDLERRAPGRLLVVAVVPSWAPPGPAMLVTNLQYTCNPLHRLWPIPVTTTIPFEVLP
jgi:hypothetical protein